MTRTSRLHAAALAAILFALGAGAAHAQGYVGGAIGPARINVDCSGADSCDKTSTGGKLYGGWLFTPQWAAELGYFDWGKAKASGTIEVVDGPEPIIIDGRASVRGTGFGVGVAYIAPFTPQWSGVARLGIARNKGKTTLTDTSTSASVSESFTSTEPYFGFGVGYEFMRNLAVTGEVDFSRVKYSDSDKARTTLFSVGLRYKF